LQGFQLAQAAMESAFNTGLVTGEAIELGLELVIIEEFRVGLGIGAELGFHAANPEQVPGGGYQFIEHGLLQRAARVDFGLVIGAERFEFFAVLEGNEDLGGGEAVLARVLGGLSFAGFSARSGAELGVGGVCDLTCWRCDVVRNASLRAREVRVRQGRTMELIGGIGGSRARFLTTHRAALRASTRTDENWGLPEELWTGLGCWR